MSDFATKDDLKALETSLRGEIGGLREDFHVLGVRFERLESKVDALGEGLMGLREHVTDEMRKLREELSARITLLEEAVRENSRDIRKNTEDIRKNSEDIRKNSEDIRKNSEDIEVLQAEVANLRRRFDRYEQESELEKRVTEIEKRLGIR